MVGQQRVIIENVSPQVDGGLYPAKRTVGERVHISADIFGDGHDHIRARALYKKQGDKLWKSVEMLNIGNDMWQTSFVVTEKGRYIFTIAAWIDHFETWYDGFKKKAAAGVDVHLELKEGAIMLRKLSGGKDKELLALAAEFDDTSLYSQSIQKVLADAFAIIVHANAYVEYETVV